METTFNLGGGRKLTIGNRVMGPDCISAPDMIGMVLIDEPVPSPSPVPRQVNTYACGCKASAPSFSAPLPDYCAEHPEAMTVNRRVDPEEPQPAPTVTLLAAFKPHEARAVASVLLAAATEAKG